MCVCVRIRAGGSITCIEETQIAFESLKQQTSRNQPQNLVFSWNTLWDCLWPFFSNTDVGVFQSPLRIFHNLKDVGFLQVKVIRAEGLMAADVTGKK